MERSNLKNKRISGVNFPSLKNKKFTLKTFLMFREMELSSPKKLNDTFLYFLEIIWLMLLDGGLYWFDYHNNVQVESQVANRTPSEMIIRPNSMTSNQTLSDTANVARYQINNPHTEIEWPDRIDNNKMK